MFERHQKRNVVHLLQHYHFAWDVWCLFLQLFGILWTILRPVGSLIIALKRGYRTRGGIVLFFIVLIGYTRDHIAGCLELQKEENNIALLKPTKFCGRVINKTDG